MYLRGECPLEQVIGAPSGKAVGIRQQSRTRDDEHVGSVECSKGAGIVREFLGESHQEHGDTSSEAISTIPIPNADDTTSNRNRSDTMCRGDRARIRAD